MIRRPPRSTLDRSSAASDVYKRQGSAPCIPRNCWQRCSDRLCLENADLDQHAREVVDALLADDLPSPQLEHHHRPQLESAAAWRDAHEPADVRALAYPD